MTRNDSGLSPPAGAADALDAPAAPNAGKRGVLVLGIGNILWADEGFGPRAAEALHQKYRTPEGVDVMDGGTLGSWLVNEICASRRLLVFDCCDLKAAPGTLRVLRRDEIRIWASTKISPHQTGFNDLLATAALMGEEPEDLAVVGVQPELLDDYGGSLTPTLRARVPEAVEAARTVLAEWGWSLEARPEGEKVEPLTFRILEMDAYEAGRPSEEEACRTGDERFLVRGGGRAVPDALERG
ncbi:HyaD/HybD family hydrogenase maturation endopeptidase [uncultured Sutterella sp.]|uniref:HyaD/HybD family hydrogenase maturation endopeptidase n=1 Tax=uncultured Sutterella sp. TaxID=286133 RepID=UPI0025CBD762|nr:HyaD/HybD family hydrogenase maturation endopeptidase [uncultured Sutterella sp.]